MKASIFSPQFIQINFVITFTIKRIKREKYYLNREQTKQQSYPNKTKNKPWIIEHFFVAMERVVAMEIDIFPGNSSRCDATGSDCDLINAIILLICF